jgi:hypothetical protein
MKQSYYERMLKYAGKYEISIQFWGESNTNAFISKDGIELYSIGGNDPETALQRTVEYLDRINGKENECKNTHCNTSY